MIFGAALIDLPVHEDRRGNLIALDRYQSLPFGVERVIFISSCPESAIRGEHATSGHLALVALTGSVTVDLDNGREQATLQLSRPNQALCVHAGVWVRLRNFTRSAIVLEVLSTCYRDVTYFDEPRPDLLRELRWEKSP